MCMMNTDTIRLNITIPREIFQDLEKLAGPRKRSRFIAQAVKEKIERHQKRELDTLLTEGYQSCRQEGIELSKEFESMDIGGWDEY